MNPSNHPHPLDSRHPTGLLHRKIILAPHQNDSDTHKQETEPFPFIENYKAIHVQ
jgi:hypothetical protein